MGFANRENVRVKFMNRSSETVGLVEALVDQATLDRIEAALFPPASEQAKIAAYRDAIDLLECQGVAGTEAVLIELHKAVSVEAEVPEVLEE